MTNKLKLLASASGVAVAVLGATPAFAAGTASGTSITNTATVNYQVGGVAQTAVNASVAFTVDRKINLTVAEVANVTTTVAPGQTAAVTTFTVTNTSNATLDIGLSVTQITGGTASHGGTDNFDVTAPTMAVDTNGNGTYEAGTDTVVTYLDELAADASRTVFIIANIPVGQANASVAEVNLIGQARESGVAGTQGAVSTETTGANTAGVDTVFADTAGTATGDVARDGRHSDDDDYTVQTALLTVAKQSRIVSDPFNGTTNPKMIPGATVEYCIVVVNAAGGGAADSVAISDPIPANTTFVAGSIRLSGTYTGTVPTGTCNADGVAGGTFASNTVSGSLGTIATGTTRTLYFNVTVN
jgi:uncharacterized repeat protein (TIGR01451 family)